MSVLLISSILILLPERIEQIILVLNCDDPLNLRTPAFETVHSKKLDDVESDAFSVVLLSMIKSLPVQQSFQYHQVETRVSPA